MDILKRFADDCLMFSVECGRDLSCPRTDLYKRYVEWCGDNGHKYTSSRKFYTAFLSRFAGSKVFEHRKADARTFRGVDIKGRERVIEAEDDIDVQTGGYQVSRTAYNRLSSDQQTNFRAWAEKKPN